MSASQTGQHLAAAAGGGTGWGTPAEDDGAVVGVIEAAFQVDPNGDRYYDASVSGVVKAGVINIPGKQDHFSKWTAGSGGNGTWDGLQRR